MLKLKGLCRIPHESVLSVRATGGRSTIARSSDLTLISTRGLGFSMKNTALQIASKASVVRDVELRHRRHCTALCAIKFFSMESANAQHVITNLLHMHSHLHVVKFVTCILLNLLLLLRRRRRSWKPGDQLHILEFTNL